MQVRAITQLLARALLDVGLAVVIYLAESQLIRRRRQRSTRRPGTTTDV